MTTYNEVIKALATFNEKELKTISEKCDKILNNNQNKKKEDIIKNMIEENCKNKKVKQLFNDCKVDYEHERVDYIIRTSASIKFKSFSVSVFWEGDSGHPYGGVYLHVDGVVNEDDDEYSYGGFIITNDDTYDILDENIKLVYDKLKLKKKSDQEDFKNLLDCIFLSKCSSWM